MVAEECWEEPLYEIEKMGVRVMKCRAGIVSGKGNIATQIFTLISKLNLSGPIGDGNNIFLGYLFMTWRKHSYFV